MRITLIPCLAGLMLAAAGPRVHAAEWTQLHYPASSGAALYADPATERLKHGAVLGLLLGNPVQAWFVTDFATPHRWTVHQVLSSKQWLEMDCQNTSLRVLTRLYYDGPMAQGRVVATEPEARQFTRVVPGEPEEAMLRSACARTQEPPPTPPQTQAGTPTAAPPDAAVTSPADAPPAAP
jgi:hypothetical protein